MGFKQFSPIDHPIYRLPHWCQVHAYIIRTSPTIQSDPFDLWKLTSEEKASGMTLFHQDWDFFPGTWKEEYWGRSLGVIAFGLPESVMYLAHVYTSKSRINHVSIYLSICLSACPSVRLFVCPSVRLSICPSIHLSIYPSIYRSIHRSIDPSIDRSIDPSIHRSIDLSIYRSIDIYLSIDLSIYLSIYLSLSIYLFIYLSIYRSIYLSTYLSIYLSTYLSIYA